MSDILTGFNMQGNDPIDDRIVSKSILETLEEYLKRVPVQKRYYGLTFFALDKDNKLRQYTFQTSLIEPTIDDSDDRIDKLQENIDNVDKDLQEHKNDKSIHKTSEEIRSEIVEEDIPDSIARVRWVTESIGLAIENIIAGASTDYDTLKKVQTKIEELRAEMESQLYGDDGSGIFKTLEQVLDFLNEYKDFIVDIPNNFVSKTDIIDNLTTDDANKVLSARQGKILSETLTNYFDSAMQSIRSETDRATNAENRIEAKLDNEITRSTNKDTEHDTKLNALEGKSHTQNTDLGTTSSTFQLKYNTGNKIKHESDAISVRNSADTDYVNFIANNATFKGDLLVEGKSFVTEAETVEIKDNLLLLNKGEVGSGVTKGMAGLEIDRGTEPNYQIVFDESDNRFKAGEIGDIQCLALRDGDDSMTGGMFTSWDATTKRLKTTNIVPEDRELIFSGPKTVSLFYSDIYEGLALSKMGDGSFIAISPSSAEIKIDSKPDDIYYSGNIKADSFVRSTDKSPALHEADLVNDLTTGGATKPLTAEQGKLLKSSIDGLSTDLSKYALLAGNNTFSGSNTFALNKFQVGTGSLFRVNADANLIVDGIVTGGWNKELVYYSREASSSTAVKRGAFGIKADGATEHLDTDYLYLSVGEANWKSAQYKFQANKLIVPNTWRLRTLSDLNLIKVDDVNEVRFGSNSIPNYLVSNNTDITHVRGSNNYKIYDSYNLPSPASTTDLSKYALLAGDNKFTGSNTFNETVSIVGSGTISLNPITGINYKFLSTSVSRGYSITLGTADNPRTTTFGSVFMDSEYAYIAIPGTSYSSTPYKFLVDQMTVPNVFSFLTKGGVLLLRKDSNGIQLGSGSSNTFVNSSNSDLTHRKYTASSTYTDYKIWDESNLPSPVQTSDLVDYVVKSDLDAYATKSWVGEQNYLTTASLDGYAKTTDLASYLPLAGGTLTGDLVLSNNNYIRGILSTGTPIQILGLNSSNTISVGNGSYNLLLYTGASDISHWKGGTSYKIWDASNVSRPLNYVNGTAGSVTSVYTRNLNLNGTSYPFIGTGTSVVTLFAPTTAGTSGQVLQSQGAGKAPIWVDGGTGGGGVQLSDDNVWTGLNTFQGGLKTSDGTNTYDVWANDILKYPVKYEINSIGNYNFNYYTKTAGWRRIDQVAINNILPDTITSLTNGGYGTLGLGTNAYESAAIAYILTNSIYFEGLNARVLSTNSDGDLEYGSTTNYGDFNSRNIRIAYPMSSGSGGSGGGSSTTYEGGLTIGYYPVNTKGTVTERAKIYCTTSNLYLKDLAKNTQLDFDADGLYVTTGSTSKVRLATLNDVSGGGSSISLDGNNTWTGVNIFSGTGRITNQYDSGNTEIPATANYAIRLACEGTYNEYGFGAVRSEERVKQSYAFIRTPAAFFTFDNSGSLYTTIGNTKYEFWNKNNLAKPITYNTNTKGNAILYKGDSASKIDGLVLLRMMPDDSTSNILQGGTGGFGSAEHAYASCHIGAVYTNEIHTYIDNDMTATVNLTIDDNGVYFAKSDGTLYKLTMEAVS